MIFIYRMRGGISRYKLFQVYYGLGIKMLKENIN